MKVYSAVKRSAVVIVSSQIKESVGSYVSTPQYILLLVAAQFTLTYLRSVPGFSASWDALRSIAQNLVIQSFIGFVTESWSDDLVLLNVVATLTIVECVPDASGWVGQDLASFRTGVTYVFSDKISSAVSNLGIPAVTGAALSACVSPRHWGILGETLALTGVNLLSEAVFGAVNGGFALALVWPVVLLYFLRELTLKYDYFQSYFDFGVYKASSLLYNSLVTVHGVSYWQVALVFGFVLLWQRRDRLWDALSALVIVSALSDWLLKEVLEGISKTDPVLAGFILITVMFFVGCAVDKGHK